MICSYERRDAKEQRASDRTAEEAGLFTEALLKSSSWGKDLSAAYQSQSSTKKVAGEHQWRNQYDEVIKVSFEPESLKSLKDVAKWQLFHIWEEKRKQDFFFSEELSFCLLLKRIAS